MNASKTKQERTRPSMRRLTALAGLGVCMCFSAVRAGTFNFPTAGGDLTTGWGDSVPTADDDVVVMRAGRYTTQTPVVYKSLRTGAKGGAVFDFSENGATAALSGDLMLGSTDKEAARANKLELLGGNWTVGGNLTTYSSSQGNAITTLVNAATLTVNGTLDIGRFGNDQVMSVVNGGKVTVGGRVYMSFNGYGQSLLEIKGKDSSFVSSASTTFLLSTGLGSNRVEVSEGGYFEVTAGSFQLGRTAGRGHDRLVVDGGSKAYVNRMTFAYADNNLVRIDNKSSLETVGASKETDEWKIFYTADSKGNNKGCGSGNGIIIDHCSCWSNAADKVVTFLSYGSNNFVRIDHGSSFCLPSGTFRFGDAAAGGPLNNRLFVGEASNMSVPNLYFKGHGNALVVSNGTIRSAGNVELANNGGTNTVVLSGCRPLIQTETAVKVTKYARIVVSPTEAGFEKDHVAVCCRDFTLDATSRLAVDADRFLQRTGGCLTVVRATHNMTVDSSALEASNADLPSGVRFEVNGRDLILRCPSRKGLMILLK